MRLGAVRFQVVIFEEIVADLAILSAVNAGSHFIASRFELSYIFNVAALELKQRRTGRDASRFEDLSFC